MQLDYIAYFRGVEGTGDEAESLGTDTRPWGPFADDRSNIESRQPKGLRNSSETLLPRILHVLYYFCHSVRPLI